MSDPTSRLLPRTARRRRWEWRALAVVVIVALCGFAATSGIRFRAQVPHNRHYRPAERNESSLPVVLWHGLGDSCCASHSIGYVANLISDSLGVYVHSIATGDGTIADVSSTFFGNVNDQVAKVCEELADMPELKGGFNAIGFSQGGQFMRAVVERCQGTEANGRPRMHTLVTMGGQHQGIYNLPNCQTDEDDPRDKPTAMCLTVQRLVAAGAYLPFIRDQLIQAQYFKDPFRMDDYLASNIFLPDINNEREVKNATYADNLASLERLVLYRFEKEYTVVPRGSEWFDFFDGTRLVNMSDTDLYKEDWIGLRRLDEAGGVFRGQVDDSLHMQFTDAWFTENVIDKFLRGHAE